MPRASALLGCTLSGPFWAPWLTLLRALLALLLAAAEALVRRCVSGFYAPRWSPDHRTFGDGSADLLAADGCARSPPFRLGPKRKPDCVAIEHQARFDPALREL